jgi:hypothetical protein
MAGCPRVRSRPDGASMQMSKRCAPAAFIASLVASSLTAGLLATPSSPASIGRISCGVERWKVKTLQDRPTLLPVQTTTIAYLIDRRKPSPLPGTRAHFERHQFKLTAQVNKVISEDDGDKHLVLEDAAGHTMIAEAPTLSCTNGATVFRRYQMMEARAAVTACTKAEITGVAFFDFLHHQTGVAPNEIELHPILAFKCLTR